MNKILTQESYNDINATLYKLRDQILDVDHGDTRRALMEQRDLMKRMIDGFKPVVTRYHNQNGMTGFDPPPPKREHIEPPLKSVYELPDPPAGLESCDAFWNVPLFPRWINILRGKNENR